MAEKPIIFSASMVQAILVGRKTQTRRVVKADGWPEMRDPVQNEITPTEWWFSDGMAPLGPFRCPYGQPGDTLWVRETYALHEEFDDVRAGDIGYYWGNVYYKTTSLATAADSAGKWRPAIFMPRWASRLTLRVTGVRVERVQDINRADAIAEGVYRAGGNPGLYTPQHEFKQLWDGINKKRGYSFQRNPWVWVIEFEVAPQ